MKLRVVDMVGKNCITVSDGEAIHRAILPALRNNEEVELDFEGTAVFASPFLNASIGSLLKDVKPDDLNRLLRVTNLNQDGMTVLSRVVDNSKAYYSGRTAEFDKIVGEPPGKE